MAKNLDPKCKQCRREGEKLFLKGERCLTPKCAMIRKSYPPGAHGQKRRRPPSEYGVQLREKQKIRRIYGILERQFRKYFKKAAQKKGPTGQLLLTQLETRFDNIVYRLGFAASRSLARQLINHGHFKINNKKMTIPSAQVKPGDIISIKEKSRELNLFKNLKSILKSKEILSWLALDKQKLEGKVVSWPDKKDLELGFNMSLVVEYYSR